MDTQNTPYSIKKPDNWDLISEYTRGGSKPDSLIAEEVLNTFLENIKLSNCEYFEDVCNAILNRIPGKIEAENYGHGGFNRSYFVLDKQKMSEFYRKKEPVQIKLDSIDKEQSLSEQHIELQKSEWVVYNFKSLENKKYQLIMRTSAEVLPAKLILSINNKNVDFTVSNKDLSEVTVGDYYLNKGDNKIKILVESNILKLDWLRFSGD
jgi:hypothetical protein